MLRTSEIAPDLYRMPHYVPELDLQFNYFLLRDEEPFRFGTGYRATFPLVRDAVATLLDPAQLRLIGFSHFESDECGALNQRLEAAPAAEPVCSFVGVRVSAGRA